LTAEIKDLLKKELPIRTERVFVVLPETRVPLVDQELSLTSNMKQWAFSMPASLP